VLKRHLKAAGLPDELTWHSFRRGGATAHSAEAVDPFTLQQLMRHSSLAVTESYLRPVVRGGKAAAERLGKRVRGT
jgi:integrase